MSEGMSSGLVMGVEVEQSFGRCREVGHLECTWAHMGPGSRAHLRGVDASPRNSDTNLHCKLPASLTSGSQFQSFSVCDPRRRVDSPTGSTRPWQGYPSPTVPTALVLSTRHNPILALEEGRRVRIVPCSDVGRASTSSSGV